MRTQNKTARRVTRL